MTSKHTEPRMVTHPLGTEFYTVKQVAASFGFSTNTIYEAIEAGKLEARKSGKQFLISREAVRAYYESFPLAGKRHGATNKQT